MGEKEIVGDLLEDILAVDKEVKEDVARVEKSRWARGKQVIVAIVNELESTSGMYIPVMDIVKEAGKRGIPQVIGPAGLECITPRRSAYTPEYKTRKLQP